MTSRSTRDFERHHLAHGVLDGLVGRQTPPQQVPVDVLHRDNGVVDEQSEREDQREEGHAVDRVTGEQVDHQRQRR